MSSFIDRLTISQRDKSKLKGLGTDTPFALLGLIEAAPDAFASLLGPSADTVRDQVAELVSPEQRNLVLETAHFPLGAQISAPPRVAETRYDVSLRNRLFEQWQSLQSEPSTRNSPQARRLERQLTEMLGGE